MIENKNHQNLRVGCLFTAIFSAVNGSAIQNNFFHPWAPGSTLVFDPDRGSNRIFGNMGEPMLVICHFYAVFATDFNSWAENIF